MTDSVSLAARLVILAPFVASILGLWVARRREASTFIATSGSVLSLLAGLYVLFAIHNGPYTQQVSTIGALPLGGQLQIPLNLFVDDLSAIVVVAVAVVGLAVQLFSTWYLHEDDRVGVFVASVSLFLAAMFLVVLSGDLVLTLIGWEVMGWCSYLLIGHNSRLESARRAATKAFLVTRIGDFGMMLGILLLWAYARTFDFNEIEKFLGVPGGHALPLALIGVLIFCGAVGKSAQFPLHVWLPDAMEGPTPVSALIHAATMVAAGVYMLCRVSWLILPSATALTLIAWIGGITAIMAATSG